MHFRLSLDICWVDIIRPCARAYLRYNAEWELCIMIPFYWLQRFGPKLGVFFNYSKVTEVHYTNKNQFSPTSWKNDSSTPRVTFLPSFLPLSYTQPILRSRASRICWPPLRQSKRPSMFTIALIFLGLSSTTASLVEHLSIRERQHFLLTCDKWLHSMSSLKLDREPKIAFTVAA